MKNFTKSLYLFLLMIAIAPAVKAQVVLQTWATLATGTTPQAIAIDASGTLYTANFSRNNVSKITASGAVTQVWAALASGASPAGVAVDASGNVYTANFNNTVSKITPSGTVTQAWAVLSSTARPFGIAIDASGNVYTGNNGNSTVSKVTPSGTVTQAWATLASDATTRGIVIDASGNIYTANNGNSTVSKVTPSGTVTQVWATLASGAGPLGIAMDASGNVYTANNGNGSVSKVTSSGTVTQAWAATSATPAGIAVDASGNVYTANNNNNTVSKITPNGTVTGTWATTGASGSGFYGITTDATGNVYTANSNNTVSKIISSCTWTGTTSTAWSTTTNWNAKVVPKSGVEVVIPTGTPNVPVVGSGTVAVTDTLTIQNGAVLTVASNSTLTTSNLVNNGGLVIAPGGNYTGSYTDITGSGSFTLQQTIIGQRGWRVLANPFSTATNIATVATANGIAIGTSVPASGLTDSRTYSNATDSWVNVTGSTWAANTPYALFIRGLTSEVTGSSYTAGPSAFTYSVSGTFNGTSTTITPDAANHFMVVGNPYAAAVTSSALTNGAGQPYYTYKISQGADQTAQRTKAGGWIAQLSSSTTTTLPVLGVIAYQPAAATPYTVTTADIKTNGSMQTGLFRVQDPVQYLEMDIEQEGLLQDKLFVRVGNSNNQLTKLANDNVNLYTIDAAHHYWAIDARQQLKDSIAVGISATAGSYKFSVANLTLDNTTIYLKDNWLHTQTALQQGSNYSFAVTADAGSKGEGRFQLLFINTAPIAVPVAATNITMAPNPVTGMLTVTSSGTGTIRIMDLLGRLIRTVNITGSTMQIPVTDLQKGLYLVEVKDATASITGKIVKQ